MIIYNKNYEIYKFKIIYIASNYIFKIVFNQNKKYLKNIKIVYQIRVF